MPTDFDCIDAYCDAQRFRCSPRFYGRAPSRTTDHRFQVVVFEIIDGHPVPGNTEYFGILHLDEAIAYARQQHALGGRDVWVLKTLTLDAIDRGCAGKSTLVWEPR